MESGSNKQKIRAAIDIGGTFTDLIYFKSDQQNRIQEVNATKVDTTIKFEEGLINAIDKVNLDYTSIETLIHGSTIVINALTQKKGAQVGLITSKGFRDVLELGRGNRPDFFNSMFQKQECFVQRYLRRELPGIISYQGNEIVKLDTTELEGILQDFKQEGVEAIAVCFLGSYVDPIHEVQVQERISQLWSEIQVVCSYQIIRQWREYERTSTTVLSAFVKPVVKDYLEKLSSELKKHDFGGQFLMMQSNCGVSSIESSIRNPISLVESGPSSGFQGAATLGKLLGIEKLIALDIGGTTAKCSLVKNGSITIHTDYYIEKDRKRAGYPILTPVVDLVEIGNGGGSKAWVDQFSKLHVGPESAGSNPGPIAYGKGGTDVTTTDANLYLGRLNKDDFCDGKEINLEPIRERLEILGSQLGLNPVETAHSIIRLANENMINAIKLISINKGEDPREYALFAFGGGGGMHAAFLAQELGIKKVVIPKYSSVFSALGMLMSDIRRDQFSTNLIPLQNQEAAEMIQVVLKQMEDNERKTSDGVDSVIRFERYALFQYENQNHTIEVQLPDQDITPDLIPTILQEFHASYRQQYKYSLEKTNVLIVGFHLVSYTLSDHFQPSLAPTIQTDSPTKGKRNVYFNKNEQIETVIYNGRYLWHGMDKIEGPAIIEDQGATIVIPNGFVATIDEYGNVIIEIKDHQKNEQELQDQKIDPITVEIIQNALEATATEMFDVFKRTAMSTIISEVLDMATGITDRHGNLTCSGMGVPGFVGCLGAAVKAILKKFEEIKVEIFDGDLFILNDPYNGGITHLNDHLLLKPVFYESSLVAWCCNIAHWGDIGGHMPGSMDPKATEIFHEGIIIPGIKLINRGTIDQSIVDTLKANTRLPDFLNGDLMAGIASVNKGGERILELLNKYGSLTFNEAIDEYFDYGEKLTREGLKKVQKGIYTAQEIQENGLLYKVKITIEEDKIVIDLEDNPDQQEAPFNLSHEATCISVGLVMKALTSPDNLVYNAGSTRLIEVKTRKGSVFNPEHPFPQSFYYETMMRVADLAHRALSQSFPDVLPAGDFSSICGTVIGGVHPDTGKKYSIIEPQPGGWGASKYRDGASCLYSPLHGQTYFCPCEVTEARNGLQVLKFTFNDEDGGEGQYNGGKGICIQYKIRSPDSFILISYTRSKLPPWGLNNGNEGSLNYIKILRDGKGQSEQISECFEKIKAGDIIEVRTANGGGWGDPKLRSKDLILNDLKNGFITIDKARQVYGFNE